MYENAPLNLSLDVIGSKTKDKVDVICDTVENCAIKYWIKMERKTLVK